MAKVKIVTDSLADIPLALMKGLEITVVPCTLHFGNKTYRDKMDLTTADFYRLLATHPTLPTTSHPSVGIFEEVYTQLARETSQIFSIHIASVLSGTWNAANIAAKSVSNGHLTVEVFDSQQLSMAQGWLVVLAARAAMEGRTLAAIKAMVSEAQARARIIAMLDTLEYAQRSGRLGKAAGMVGSLLNIKPLLSLSHGEVVPLGGARTQNSALERLVEIALDLGLTQELAIVHCYAEVLARRLKGLLMAHVPEDQITIAETGPVSGAHVGPGAVCITGLVKK